MVEIRQAGVVGCGLMGSGIAEVCARAGLTVLVHDQSADAVARGRQRIEESLSRAVSRGKLTSADRDSAYERLSFTTDLGEFADCDLVIEAVTEREDVKLDIFATVDKILVKPDALLASNTSSIPIMKLGAATSRPESVLGLHFFNPVPVMPLVELVTSLLTGREQAERAAAFVSQALGKHLIRSQDRAGFVVNALLVPYLLSAIRMVESGFASAEDIDNGMVHGCAHPMGPLQLSDLIGLDTLKAIALSLYEEFKEALYSPPPQLLRMVDAGLLGRKTGQGFYRYPAAATT